MATATREQRRGGRRLTATVLISGLTLVIVAVAGLVITPEHAPSFSCGKTVEGVCWGFSSTTTGWPQTTYDAARIATWAALIVGAVLVLLGLIRFAQRGRKV
jgi:hypothetical protein